MTITNYGNLTHDQLLDETIVDGLEEEAWARSLGFRFAAEYHRESDEAFAEWARYQA